MMDGLPVRGQDEAHGDLVSAFGRAGSPKHDLALLQCGHVLCVG